MDSGATVASMARPKRMARSTAARFITGSTPGRARSTAQAWVLGAAPKAVEAPLKILLRVLSWAWVSSPITTSQPRTSCAGIGDAPLIAGPPGS